MSRSDALTVGSPEVVLEIDVRTLRDRANIQDLVYRVRESGLVLQRDDCRVLAAELQSCRSVGDADAACVADSVHVCRAEEVDVRGTERSVQLGHRP